MIDEHHSGENRDRDVVAHLRAIAEATRGTPEGRATYIEASRAVGIYVRLRLRAHAEQCGFEPLPPGQQHSLAYRRFNAANERLKRADRNGPRQRELANFHEALADLRYQANATCSRARRLLTQLD